MEIPKPLKIGAIVLVGVGFAFLAGYTIFSYFSRNRVDQVETQQPQNTDSAQPENESEGVIPGSVSGATDYSQSEGISPTPGATGSTNNQNALKGGVLGESTNTQDGITPNNTTPQRTRITPVTQDEEEFIEDDNDESEITSAKTPEVNVEDDYVEYIYAFDFNNDAQDRYKDGFKYTIDAGTCDDSDFFTSSNYDFSGTISSDEIDDEVTIKVRIKDKYIDDEYEFDNSDYKFDGKNYIVRGDIHVPQCED